jgi:WXXGXW repeat (2 copies)
MTASRFWRTTAGMLILLATVWVSPACASPRGRIYVRVGPPFPIVETPIVAPGPGYFWVPGFHTWTGSVYAWVPGRWDRPPRPRAIWVPGRWVHERRGWYFVEGRWR